MPKNFQSLYFKVIVALIFGIDRFMSEGKALPNIIDNTVANFVIAKWAKK